MVVRLSSQIVVDCGGAASISQLAVNGTTNPSECKFTVTVPEIEILDVIEIIPCSDKAVKSIENVPVWAR